MRSMAIAAAAIAMLALTTMVSACSSSGHPTASAAAAPVAESACQQVGDALSNGPDPDTDPVGYAEAQIQPLRQIHATEPGARPGDHHAGRGLQQLLHGQRHGAGQVGAEHGDQADQLAVPGRGSGGVRPGRSSTARHANGTRPAEPARGRRRRRDGPARGPAGRLRRRRLGRDRRPVDHPLQRPARADHRRAGDPVREGHRHHRPRAQRRRGRPRQPDRRRGRQVPGRRDLHRELPGPGVPAGQGAARQGEPVHAGATPRPSTTPRTATGSGSPAGSACSSTTRP